MNRQRAFTLIEMLVVMTLIATLLTLAVPRYFTALENGRLRVQAQNVATLRDAIDKFYADQGRYPEALDELVAKKYLRQIPLDPVSEAANWLVLAPKDTAQGNVYDVAPNPVQPLAPGPQPEALAQPDSTPAALAPPGAGGPP